MIKIGFIDYYLDEWHANNYPEMLRELSDGECQVICAFAARLDPTIEELSDLRVVVSEAVTNCVVHAYKGCTEPGTIQITVRITEKGILKIKIKDNGCGMADIERCMQPLYTTDRSGERSGMGFSVMESFMTHLSVSSTPGRGTRVVMWKHLL